MPDKTKCMASKAAVDLHDHLKRDMMTLFSLEKVLQKKVRMLTCCGSDDDDVIGTRWLLPHVALLVIPMGFMLPHENMRYCSHQARYAAAVSHGWPLALVRERSVLCFWFRGCCCLDSCCVFVLVPAVRVSVFVFLCSYKYHLCFVLFLAALQEGDVAMAKQSPEFAAGGLGKQEDGHEMTTAGDIPTQPLPGTLRAHTVVATIFDPLFLLLVFSGVQQ